MQIMKSMLKSNDITRSLDYLHNKLEHAGEIKIDFVY